MNKKDEKKKEKLKKLKKENLTKNTQIVKNKVQKPEDLVEWLGQVCLCQAIYFSKENQ